MTGYLRRFLGASLAAVLLVPAFSAHAGTAVLVPASLASAIDNGPADGAFDSFTGEGSINNNGFTELRTNMEFDLAGLTPGSVGSATLTFTLTAFEGVRQLEVHGGGGDGSVDLADFSLDGLIEAIVLDTTSASVVSYSIDVTMAVQAALLGGASHVAFGVRESPANSANFDVIFMEIFGPGPQLTVTAVPLPAAGALMPAALVLVGLARGRRKHTA